MAWTASRRYSSASGWIWKAIACLKWDKTLHLVVTTGNPLEPEFVKVLFFANTDWYLYNFRLPLATYVREQGHEVVMLSPSGPYVARLQAAGFRALTVPMQRRS